MAVKKKETSGKQQGVSSKHQAPNTKFKTKQQEVPSSLFPSKTKTPSPAPSPLTSPPSTLSSSTLSTSSVSTPLLVGVITHYYSKIGVGVVRVKKDVKLGDALQISGRGRSFAQKVKSMQLEHKPLTAAKKGLVIGLKVSKPVKPNDVVYRFG